MKKYICIHGHFYQPPRQNPWLEAVEVQDSAAPYHDWNQRVTAECYAPNTAARILGEGGRITRIVNNFRRISFNFGPTLLNWLEDEAPEVYAAVLEADAYSLKRWGHGNALAQVYNHVIMPLAGLRDKLTQIRWGIRDFERRFGRRPDGMWLAETAVDLETLACLAQEGIAFTILSPYQAAHIRPSPDEPWQDVAGGRLDPRRPYKVPLPGGGHMAVFFYDGPLSRAIAFEKLLQDGSLLARRLKELFAQNPSEDQLVNIATDGESYGHHHRFGEMALAFALADLDKDPEVELTNYAAFLAAHPPKWEAEIPGASSWSCPHGVERWRSNCGCALDPNRGWNQRWRTPLRQAFDLLNEKLAEMFARLGRELFKDPWAARDAYADLAYQFSPEAWRGFLERHQVGVLDEKQRVRAAKLLECQRWGMFMFTSCAWFFDDISGLEAVQNLRFAARALQLAQELNGQGWEEEILGVLTRAVSNLASEGNGAQIWRRHVASAKVGPLRVMAHAAISRVMRGAALPEKIYCYHLKSTSRFHRHNLEVFVSWGEARLTHDRLGEVHHLAYAALHGGGTDFQALVAPASEAKDLASLGDELEQPLRLLEKFRLMEILRQHIGGDVFTLADLFLEERRSLAEQMIKRAMARDRQMARNLYEGHLDTIIFLRQINVPLPRVFASLAQALLTDELAAGVRESGPGPLPNDLKKIAEQAKALGLSLASDFLRHAFAKALTRDLKAVLTKPDDPGPMQHAGDLLDLAATLEMEFDLWEAQNCFYRLLGEKGPENLPAALAELGRRLGFDLKSVKK